jgi:hypothetical protein
MTTLAVSQVIEPLTDPDFVLERDGAKKMVHALLPVFTRLLTAKPRTKSIKDEASKLGWKFATLRERFYKWRNGGCDWRLLIDRAKFPEPDRCTFPPAFETFVTNIYESHQRDRTAKTAYRILMARLTEWEKSPFAADLAIPGYVTPPRRSPYTHHPIGWSYRNICRLLERTSNAYQRTVRRQGTKAASEFLPSIRTSRVGLAFGQIFFFDDSQHDVYVNLTGRNRAAMRPLSFNCLEALSGSLCLLGLKPEMEEIDPITKRPKKRVLDQLDFFWFVMLQLTTVGYNAREGSLLVWEHGTANVDKAAGFDENIQRVTGGKVFVDRSGKFGRPEFKAMLFEGKPSGNFRFKAPIESFFQNVRNYSAALPAPTGLNPDRAPDESHGLLLRNKAIQALIDKLDAPTFLRLKRHILEWEDYARICRAIHDIIDRRDDHDLQGYRKLGFTKQSYRLSLDSPHWMSEREYQLIPAEQRAALDHITAQPGYYRSDLLSPYEVRRAHERTLTRLPRATIALLAPPRAWRAVTVSKSLEIEIVDQWIDSEPLIYIAKVTPPKGSGTITLERGRTYNVLLNPFDPSLLDVAEMDGTFLGTAKRLHIPCRLDIEAIVEQLGAAKTIRADQSVEVHSRMRTEAEKRVEDYHFNKRLLVGQAASPEEKAQARADDRQRSRAVRFGEVAGEALPVSAPDQPAGEAEEWPAADFTPAKSNPNTNTPETW